MIRIAFVINSIHLGGPSYVIRNIIRNLNSSVYKIFLITFFDAENTPEVLNELRLQNVTVIEMHCRGRAEVIISKQREFNKIIRDNKISIIHSHGFLPDVLSARCNVKKVKKITTIHNNIFTEYPEVYGYKKARVITPIHLHYLRKLKYCACCSGFVYDSMKSALRNLVTVRNGIDRTVIKYPVSRAEINVPEDAVLYIYVGQLRKRKNIIWLLKQFRQYHKSNEYLLVLGGGPDREACEMIQDPNIVLYGFTDNPYAFMQISDVYISAALSEGFSISVLEAMDNGLPLFLSDIPSHTEVFRVAAGAVIGEYFKSNNSRDFEKKFIKLRKELTNVNKQVIREIKDKQMSAEHMTGQYEKLYRSR